MGPFAFVLAAPPKAPVATTSLRFGARTYAVMMAPGTEKPLRIYLKGRLVATAGRAAWNPWKIEVADVDGDGREEIAVGVRKATPNLKFPHTSLFILGFDGKRIAKKWMGSSMGRPLADFCFAPGKPPARLYTLERTPSGVALSRYRWSGFGFRHDGTEKTFKAARELNRHNGRITVVADGALIFVESKA